MLSVDSKADIDERTASYIQCNIIRKSLELKLDEENKKAYLWISLLFNSIWSVFFSLHNKDVAYILHLSSPGSTPSK